jgi:hypothetical protein
MTEESQATDSVVAEPVTAEPQVTEPEGQIEGQAADPAGEPEGEEAKKSRAAERRERDKAYRAQLKANEAAALDRARQAEARKTSILNAGAMDAEPTESDFPDPLELSAARAIWKQDQRRAERYAKEAEREAETARKEAEGINQRERQAARESFEAQVEDAKTRYADYDAVARAPDVPVSDTMADLIVTSEQGPDVLYFLGKNRALAAQIAQMSQVEAARAIGRIEASLNAPKPRTETKAPTPISPVRGSASAGREPAKMSFAEFKAWRESGGTIRR